MRALTFLTLWLLLFGWNLFWAFRKPAAVVRISVWVISGFLCLFCLEVLSGLARSVGVWGDVGREIHRSGGHWLVIWGTLTLSMAWAATTERGVRLRNRLAVGHAVVGFAAVLLCFFAGNSEVLSRFRAIHTALLPAVLAMVLIWWWLIFRKYRRTFSTDVSSPK